MLLYAYVVKLNLWKSKSIANLNVPPTLLPRLQ